MENKPLQFLGKYPVKEWNYPAAKGKDIWRVSLWGNYKFTCTCPTYRFKTASCKHTRSQREQIEREFGSVYNYIQLLKNHEI